MKREAAQQFITARRAKVDMGARGIVQQIMGKFRTHAEMAALTALHPDTVYVRAEHPPDPAKWTKSKLTIEPTGNGHDTSSPGPAPWLREWKVEAEEHVDVLEVCMWLQDKGFTLSKLESSKKVTSNTSNILATVEFHLGTTGMATDMRCEHCKTKNVTPLSTIQEEDEEEEEKGSNNEGEEETAPNVVRVRKVKNLCKNKWRTQMRL